VPDLLLASNPGGPIQLFSTTAQNGMAGDDTTMLWAAIGALIVMVPLFYTKVRGTPAWKDPVRAAILGTWILSFVATPIQGFYIEFHEATLSGQPPDLVFGALQYFALIGITLICMALLAIDYYVDSRGTRTPLATWAIFSILLATAGGYIYTFYTTDSGSSGYWVFNVGFVLMDLFLLAAMAAVYLGRSEKIPTDSIEPAPRDESGPHAPPQPAKAPG